MKNILITGAAGNLGRAVVDKFLSEGYFVIAVDAPGTKPGKDIPGNFEYLEADLLDERSAESIVISMASKYKTIDAAILLVGGYAAGDIFNTDGTTIKKMFSLNFETAYFIARPVFEQMAKQKTRGRIVFIGARPALKAAAGKSMIAYGLSKSLLFKLSEYLNAEGADKNIVTSVVVPSTIDTPTNRQAMPKADFADWVTPDAIADLLAFIVSSESNPLRDPVYKIYGNA